MQAAPAGFLTSVAVKLQPANRSHVGNSYQVLLTQQSVTTSALPHVKPCMIPHLVGTVQQWQYHLVPAL